MAGLALAAAGCGSSMEPGDGTRVLLEVEYINNATSPQYYGFYLDDAGNLYHYDRLGVAWDLQDSTTINPPDFSDKFVPIRNFTDRRPQSEVTYVMSRIDDAANGPYSAVKSECNDAGRLTYRAFKQNINPLNYTPVLLLQEGDSAQQNTSQAAQDLIAYIRSLKLLDEISGCGP